MIDKKMNDKQEEYIPKNMLLDFLKIASTCCLPFERFGIGFAMKEISEWKPANVAPVVRGEWAPVRRTDGSIDFRCTACRRFSFHNGEMRKKYRFCPGCGAQIRETKENET